MENTDLEARAPEGWFSQYDIAVLAPAVRDIPENGIYLEIGVYKGRSLWVAREVAKPSVQVWGVDILEDPRIPGTKFIQIEEGDVAPIDAVVDLLFIDANHTYEGCKADIENYAPSVKEGGAILFHDCDETSPGVVQAVNEYAEEHNLELTIYKTPELRTSIAKIQL